MTSELFRREALLASTASQYGDALFHQPLTVRAMVIGITLIFLSFVSFAALVQIKETEMVRGHLIPSAGEIKVYSERSGVLLDIRSIEGQRVHQGDILATVAAGRSDEAGRQSTSVLLDHTGKQIAQLQERIAVLEKRALIAKEQSRARIAGLSEELALLQEEHEVVLKRLALAEQEYRSSATLLARKSISNREHNQVESTWYALQQTSTTTRLNIEGRKLALEEARQQLALQPFAVQEEWLSMQSTLSQLLAQQDELGSQGLFTLLAPADGTISNLLLRPGDTVDPRIPFTTLVPHDAVLEARLYLPSRAAGKVQMGQEIMLSYDAFPYQTHGTFAATVVNVSSSVIDPREFLIPLDLNEPAYLVRARIDQHHANSGQFRSGMQFSAEIITGSSNLLERLFSPLTSLGRKL